MIVTLQGPPLSRDDLVGEPALRVSALQREVAAAQLVGARRPLPLQRQLVRLQLMHAAHQRQHFALRTAADCCWQLLHQEILSRWNNRMINPINRPTQPMADVCQIYFSLK